MIAEIAGIIVTVGGLINISKSLPEIADRRRKKRLGQKLSQLKIQLNQIVESGYEILDLIAVQPTDLDQELKKLLIKSLYEQSMRIRTFNAIILDPDTKEMLEILDPKLRKKMLKIITEKSLHIYSDLDSFSRPIYQEKLNAIYSAERLDEIRGRLKQLEDELEKLSSLLKMNFKLSDII